MKISEIKTLLERGCSIEVEANALSLNDALALATAAYVGKSMLTIVGSLSFETMERLAIVADGHISIKNLTIESD